METQQNMQLFGQIPYSIVVEDLHITIPSPRLGNLTFENSRGRHYKRKRLSDIVSVILASTYGEPESNPSSHDIINSLPP